MKRLLAISSLFLTTLGFGEVLSPDYTPTSEENLGSVQVWNFRNAKNQAEAFSIFRYQETGTAHDVAANVLVLLEGMYGRIIYLSSEEDRPVIIYLAVLRRFADGQDLSTFQLNLWKFEKTHEQTVIGNGRSFEFPDKQSLKTFFDHKLDSIVKTWESNPVINPPEQTGKNEI